MTEELRDTSSPGSAAFINPETHRAAEGMAVAVEFAKESPDVGQEGLAAGIPLFGIGQDMGRFPEASEADFLGTRGVELGQFIAKQAKERELKAIPGFLGETDQRQRDRWSQGFKFRRDGFATDADQHVADALEKIRQGKQGKRALGFEVLLDAQADFIDEGEIVTLCRRGGTTQRNTQPGGVVLDHLMAPHLDGGTGAD